MAVIGAAIFVAAAAHATCSQQDARAAEVEAGTLHDWNAVHRSYQRFVASSHCDDGAIAEGYSASITQVLAHRWQDLAVFIRLIKTDRPFGDFVLHHIDATTDKNALNLIVLHARNQCPRGQGDLCEDIEKAARGALDEMKK